jgi:hypothetical protein
MDNPAGDITQDTNSYRATNHQASGKTAESEGIITELLFLMKLKEGWHSHTDCTHSIILCVGPFVWPERENSTTKIGANITD